jgi:hypothetical protein
MLWNAAAALGECNAGLAGWWSCVVAFVVSARHRITHGQQISTHVLTFACFERTRDVLVELPQHDHERYSHSHTRSAAHHCLTVPHNPPHVVVVPTQGTGTQVKSRRSIAHFT